MIHVLDGNRTPADVIEAADLETLAATHPNVGLTHVFSRLAAGDRTPGLRGHIDARLPSAYLGKHPADDSAQF